MNLPLTPLRFLERAQRVYKNKVGVVCGAERFTYSQFAERCCRLAGALLSMGLRPADRVALLSYNCHRLLEAYYGVLLAKGVLLPLNLRLAPPEIAFILRDSETPVLILDRDFLPLIEGIRNQLSTVQKFILLDHNRDNLSWIEPLGFDELLQRSQPVALDYLDIDDNSLAELFYTSGTSGDPKGVMLSHRNVYLHGLNVIATHMASERMIELHSIPLFHANGWGAAHALTGAGGRHVMLRKFDPQQICQWIQSEKITMFSMVPTMALVLVNYPDLGQYDLSSLEWVMVGGAAASEELIRQVQSKLGCKCYGGYGLTETAPVLTVAFLKSAMDSEEEPEKIRRQATAGYGVVGAEVRVVDDQGRDVPQDSRTVGEVVARGDGIMMGYWRRPEEDKAAFRDGWFLTGDMAVWDEDGYILIVDRRKEIIVSGGENISSLEIEKALAAHPAVYESAVIAIPDDIWGEVPKAFVVLKQNNTATAEELEAFLKTRVGKFKIPRSFEFVESLPKGGTGKIQKKLLREKYWGGHTRRVH